MSDSPEPSSPERSHDNRHGSRVAHLLWFPRELGLNPDAGDGCSQVANKVSYTVQCTVELNKRQLLLLWL